MAALSEFGPVTWPSDVEDSADSSRDGGPWRGPAEEPWLRRLLRGAALPTDAADVPRSARGAISTHGTGRGTTSSIGNGSVRPRVPAPQRGVIIALPRAPGIDASERHVVVQKGIARSSASR